MHIFLCCLIHSSFLIFAFTLLLRFCTLGNIFFVCPQMCGISASFELINISQMLLHAWQFEVSIQQLLLLLFMVFVSCTWSTDSETSFTFVHYRQNVWTQKPHKSNRLKSWKQKLNALRILDIFMAMSSIRRTLSDDKNGWSFTTNSHIVAALYMHIYRFAIIYVVWLLILKSMRRQSTTSFYVLYYCKLRHIIYCFSISMNTVNFILALNIFFF